MNMKLYGHPLSTRTLKVLTLLAEKGHKAEFVLVDLTKGEHKQPDHLARHPFGVVPALDDNGFMLYEAHAICRYLDETLSGPKLTPETAQDRALMDQWISVESSYFSPAAMKVAFATVFTARLGKPVDEDKLKVGREATTKAAVVLDRHLEGKDFFVANQFTLADICYLPYLDFLFAGKQGDLITDHKHLASWWRRCSARKSWAIATGKEGASAAH